MRQYRALVTGVGAIIGYGIVRALKRCRYPVHVIGADVYPDAVGQRWCDEFVSVPWASEAGYCDFLLSLIRERGIDLVFPGVEAEVIRLSQARESFGSESVRLVLNRQELVSLSQDKWAMHRYLTRNGLPAIPTVSAGRYDDVVALLGAPFLVKPRTATASKGIVAVDSRRDFNYWKWKLGKNFMAQKIVGDADHEYTVGVFGLGDGSLAGAIAMSRKLSREGATAKARTIECDALTKAVADLVCRFRPVGPTNLQFRRDGDQYYLLEVNARFSSSLSLRSALGFNEAEMCIDYFAEGVTPQTPVVVPGRASRFIEDWVIPE